MFRCWPKTTACFSNLPFSSRWNLRTGPDSGSYRWDLLSVSVQSESVDSSAHDGVMDPGRVKSGV